MNQNRIRRLMRLMRLRPIYQTPDTSKPATGHKTYPRQARAGCGPMAEAAVPILRARGLEGKVNVVSTYLNHAVYRGVVRGRILAAPTDSPVLQGRLSIEMAVRALENVLTTRHAGPPVWAVTPGTAGEAVIEGSLAPASFVPVFALPPPPEATSP